MSDMFGKHKNVCFGLGHVQGVRQSCKFFHGYCCHIDDIYEILPGYESCCNSRVGCVCYSFMWLGHMRSPVRSPSGSISLILNSLRIFLVLIFASFQDNFFQKKFIWILLLTNRFRKMIKRKSRERVSLASLTTHDALSDIASLLSHLTNAYKAWTAT